MCIRDRGTTRATRSGDNYTLSNGAVEAVFSGQGRFDIEKLTLNGKSVLGAGANLAPWILYYKGPQGENPCLMPEHAAYDGAAIRDDDEGKTLVFTWQLTLDYSAERYPVRMYVSLPDGSEMCIRDRCRSDPRNPSPDNGPCSTSDRNRPA